MGTHHAPRSVQGDRVVRIAGRGALTATAALALLGGGTGLAFAGEAPSSHGHDHEGHDKHCDHKHGDKHGDHKHGDHKRGHVHKHAHAPGQHGQDVRHMELGGFQPPALPDFPGIFDVG